MMRHLWVSLFAVVSLLTPRPTDACAQPVIRIPQEPGSSRPPAPSRVQVIQEGLRRYYAESAELDKKWKRLDDSAKALSRARIRWSQDLQRVNKEFVKRLEQASVYGKLNIYGTPGAASERRRRINAAKAWVDAEMSTLNRRRLDMDRWGDDLILQGRRLLDAGKALGERLQQLR
jgi:hypothetical protein